MALAKEPECFVFHSTGEFFEQRSYRVSGLHGKEERGDAVIHARHLHMDPPRGVAADAQRIVPLTDGSGYKLEKAPRFGLPLGGPWH